MSLRKLRLLGLALVAGVFVPFSARAADDVAPSELFADAERAFAAQDYREALRLFTAAREAGSTGAGTYYNIGVCHYLLRDYDAAEQAFVELANEFPAMRELAEYNRGLALRAAGEAAAARRAFERARVSTDEKIAALADAQLVELGVRTAAAPRWRGYFSGGVGYDDNVALIDEVLLPSGTASSALVEGIGVLSRELASLLRFDASGYWVRYSDTDEFDQSALRLALLASPRLGQWTLTAGPTLGRGTFDGDEFEQLVGADLRLRRSINSRFSFESRLVYDDVEAGDSRFSYIEGSRRQLRLMLQHTAAGRLRIGYDVERNDRADAGVSPSRERFSIAYQWQLAEDWTADTWLMHRESRYSDVSVPRDEELVSLSFAARRALRVGWALNAEYRWSDNDSTVPAYSYDSQRVVLALSRGF